MYTGMTVVDAAATGETGTEEEHAGIVGGKEIGAGAEKESLTGNMCVCIYIYIHSCIHTHIYDDIYMCVCVCVYLCVPIHVYMHAHTHVYTHTYLHTRATSAYA